MNKTKQTMVEINRQNYARLLIAVVGGNADEELKSWAELELLRLATKGATAI